MKAFIKEFRDFAMKGNVMSLAVGVMIGGAFSKIITSLVEDIFTPLLGLITGGHDLSGLFIALDGNIYPSREEAIANGVGTLGYGAFLTNVLDFLIIALCIFLFVKAITRMLNMGKKKEEGAAEAPPRLCPHCAMEVKEAAVRCPYCTQSLNAD